MNKQYAIFQLLVLLSVLVQAQNIDSEILSYRASSSNEEIRFFYNVDSAFEYSTFRDVIDFQSSSERLIFAMNGGMYSSDFSPVGLYIENYVVVEELDTAQIGYGNFYLQPNGVFTIDSLGRGVVVQTEEFTVDSSIQYATQSGPMLVINGKIHPAFNPSSQNRNIRNGVGILPNGDILFALSKTNISFYDFASFFVDEGCENALYLDGFVSRAYLPEKGWEQHDGKFGVIIGVIEK